MSTAQKLRVQHQQQDSEVRELEKPVGRQGGLIHSNTSVTNVESSIKQGN